MPLLQEAIVKKIVEEFVDKIKELSKPFTQVLINILSRYLIMNILKRN